MPRNGMCRRPAIRSTSGLTTRATALISRWVRGPKRIAFPAGRAGAAGSRGAAGAPRAADIGVADASRSCGMDIWNLLRQLARRAVLTGKDERPGGNVTARLTARSRAGLVRPARLLILGVG